jgi:hypothetical protein
LLCTGNTYAAIDCEKNAQLPHPLKVCSSPIIIDTDGKGFHLTSAENGVAFDIAGNGRLLQMGWTAAGSTNAFLALPHNGEIVNGKDLFGNFTPQRPSDHPNGFIALADYDKPEKGGNGDNVIDETDAIFPSLRLWIDKNHDAVAEPEEIFTLPELGVFSVSVRYRESRREDRFGNLFRYKARINLTDPDELDSKPGPLAYDVFFDSINGN